MSDNIPYEIQLEIIKKVCDVKSLMQLRSVSKSFKSFIDSYEFINTYGASHNAQPDSHILSYKSHHLSDELRYICLAEEDIGTFKVAPFVMSPLQLSVSYIVGMCRGLLCVFGYYKVDPARRILLIWNPLIGKSFGIALPRYDQAQTFIPVVFGFGVCPVTNDPTIVKIVCASNEPWHVEVFTLSSGVWNVIPRSDMPRQLTKPTFSDPVVIDKFIYWGARDMVMSFNLITKEFKVVNLPDSLKNELRQSVSVSKLRESLVVYGSGNVMGSWDCGVWVMDHDSSFTKLFTIGASVSLYKILGFSKSGEAIFEIQEVAMFKTPYVYDPCSQKIKSLGISGAGCSFFMGSYKESLLLLDKLDSHIYYEYN